MPFAKPVEEAIQPMRMVGMAMAQDDRLNGTEINAEHCQVVQCSIRRHSRIKKKCLTLSLVNNGDEQ